MTTKALRESYRAGRAEPWGILTSRNPSESYCSACPMEDTISVSAFLNDRQPGGHYSRHSGTGSCWA